MLKGLTIGESSELFGILAEIASDAIISVENDGNILFANRAAERIFGYPLSEILGQPITSLVPEYPFHGCKPAVLPHEKVGENFAALKAFQAKGLRTGGAQIPLEISVADHVLSGRRISTLVLRDVSERHRIERELSHSQEKYAQMIRSSPDAITLRSLPDRRYIEVSEGFARLTGYTVEEVMGKTPSEVGLWSDDPSHADILEKLQHDGEVRDVEFAFRTKAGEYRHASVSAVRLTQGAESYMLSISRDITERKRVESELQRSEDRFASLVQDAPYGIYRVTLEGQLLQVNPALVRMLGYDSEVELLKRNVQTDIYAEPESRKQLIGDWWQSQDFKDVEAQWKRKNGDRITVRLSGRPVERPQGEPSYFEVFAEDITERRSLERQLFQSQKMEAIGRLAGGIAHDFNNLLGVILGQTELLQAESGFAPSLHRRAEAIDESARRASELTKQLLAFSRQQVIQPRVIDTNVVVRDLEKLLKRLIGEDVQLTLRLQPNAGNIKIDPSQLEQILMNLTVNARDAMPGGGKLILETAFVELDEAYARQHLGAKAGDFVMLAVSDTGTGMDSQTMARIFEPFFTTKEDGRGTGLGLSTVYGIVKQNNGYIMTYSEPGQGTTFRVYFPCVRQSPDLRGQKSDRAEVARGSETILLVEDEKSLRELARELLEANGYRVMEAENGEKAIQLVENSQTPIHLLLTDVVMPGMTGKQLATRLLELRPELHILYMSGYTDDVINNRGVLTADTLLLPKPFTRAILLRRVREALTTKPSFSSF
ncbi:MAG TPA: PAS domain S-box protein [Candidatus Acidoferrum sp.]